MKRVYGPMSLVGFMMPMLFTYAYTRENPDIFLFIMNPAKTIELLFGDYGRAAFSADFFWVLLVFFVWVIHEIRRCGVRRGWICIPLAFLVGLSGPFPLFLYLREKALAGGRR